MQLLHDEAKRLIVHIGLGKTGTTTLQTHLFPDLTRSKGFLYNPKEFMVISSRKYRYSEQDKIEFLTLCNSSDILISAENIVDWNPRNWVSAADRALDLFGKDAIIVITVRDSHDYMRSRYCQLIQEGNIISPEEFFVDSTAYDELTPFLAPLSILRFDHQKFDLYFLKKLYQERFNEVHILPLTRLDSAYPWKQLFNMSNTEIIDFKNKLKTSPHENRSFSALALRLTVLREKFLNIFGVRSIGSSDIILRRAITKGENKDISFRKLPLFLKFREFPKRILNIMAKSVVLNWRWWMQRVLDRLVPYKKYRLPLDNVNFDSFLMEANKKLIEESESHIDTIN
jgi:hypothetical protein